MDERVHVARVEVVLLVPGRRRQHDVRVEARRAHPEVQRHEQVELAFRRLVVPHHLVGFRLLGTQVLALDAIAGAEQVLEKILVTLAARAQQVRPPHEEISRPVARMIGVLAAHLERAILQRLDHILLGIGAGGLRVADDLQRIGLQLRRGGEPAHALGAHVVVDHAAAVDLGIGERRDHLAHRELLVAPLIGVRVKEARAVLLARRADPVERERERGPAGLRPQLLLADVMRPAAAALADAAAQHQHVDDAAIVHVAVIPVIHRRADDHHRPAVRLVRVLGELACHRDHLRARHARDLLLPGRRVRRVVVEARGGQLAWKPPRDAVVRDLQVEHRGNERLALLARLAQRDAPDRHGAHEDVGVAACERAAREMLARDAAEIRKADLRGLRARACAFEHRKLELHLAAMARFPRLEVPLALVGASVGSPPETDRAVRQHDLARLVERDGLPFGIVRLAELAVEVGRANVAIRHHDAGSVRQSVLLQQHQHRHVGVAADVVVEVRAALAAAAGEIEFVEDHVAHRHRHRGVRALLRMHPDIGQLGDLGVVGRHRDGLRSLVANLGEEVRVGRARLRHVGAPRDDEIGVVPIRRLGDVGLLAPDLRARRGQVAVPVVEAHAHAAEEAQIAAAGRVAHHRHRRYRREADHAIGAVLLDRVHVGGGDDLVDLVPAGADETAEPAHALVVTARRVVLDDRSPGADRVVREPGGTPVLEQAPAHHRVLDAVRAVQIPAVGGAPRTAPRLVVGHVPARARIVGLLRLPGDDAALDIDLPRARARAVDAMRRAHDLVVRPAVAVGVLPRAVFASGHPVIAGERLLRVREVSESVEKVAHAESPRRLRRRSVNERGICAPSRFALRYSPSGRRFGLMGSSRTRSGAGRTTS